MKVLITLCEEEVGQGSRGQGAGGREYGAGSRGQGAGGREQGAGGEIFFFLLSSFFLLNS